MKIHWFHCQCFNNSSFRVRMSELPTNLLQFLLDLNVLQSTLDGQKSNDCKIEPTLPTSESVLPTPKPQKRCGACKNKLLLSDMPCRCGIRHCSAHRLPESHCCTYDHGRQDRKVLETQLVKCVADKFDDRLG